MAEPPPLTIRDLIIQNTGKDPLLALPKLPILTFPTQIRLDVYNTSELSLLASLPSEIIGEIFKSLNITHRINLALCCKQLADLAVTHDLLTRTVTDEKFIFSDPDYTPNPPTTLSFLTYPYLHCPGIDYHYKGLPDDQIIGDVEWYRHMRLKFEKAPFQLTKGLAQTITSQVLAYCVTHNSLGSNWSVVRRSLTSHESEEWAAASKWWDERTRMLREKFEWGSSWMETWETVHGDGHIW